MWSSAVLSPEEGKEPLLPMCVGVRARARSRARGLLGLPGKPSPLRDDSPQGPDQSELGRRGKGSPSTPSRLISLCLRGGLLEDVHAAGGPETDHVRQTDLGALDLAVAGLAAEVVA